MTVFLTRVRLRLFALLSAMVLGVFGFVGLAQAGGVAVAPKTLEHKPATTKVAPVTKVGYRFRRGYRGIHIHIGPRYRYRYRPYRYSRYHYGYRPYRSHRYYGYSRPYRVRRSYRLRKYYRKKRLRRHIRRYLRHRW